MALRNFLAEFYLPSRTSSASMIWFRFNGFFSAPEIGSTPARFGDFSQGRHQVQVPIRDNGSRPPIRFDRPLVIVGAGQVDMNLLHHLREEGAAIVAADGGADICALANIVPEAIIGDLDSLEDRQFWEARTRVVEIAEQHSTDFEKCLYSTHATITIALGMTGSRLDHTLAAFDTAARYGGDRHIVLVDEDDLALVVTGEFTFEVDASARVSVHPMGAVRFARSVGLEFPLTGVELAPGKRSGTSNRAVAGAFEIIPHRGETSPFLVIMDKHYLGALIVKLEPGETRE